jgi:hypothetical protein
MALIYKAKLNPSKLELVSGWLPSRTWFTGPAEVRPLAAYRFDDPAGEVGIETCLFQVGPQDGDGPVLQVPLTYRAAPLAGAEQHLLGTLKHSVLGRRWVYDGCSDPIWARELATAVLTGGTQVEELVQLEDRLQPRRPTATVSGSGTPGTPVAEIGAITGQDDGPVTIVRTGELELVLVRVVGAEVAAAHTLTGRWADGEPVLLAGVTAL